MLSRLWLLLLSSSVMSEQMDWGDNPYLVDESVTIQGREHIKLAVVVVGGSIDLECQVAFTSKPVSKIMWKIDGKLTNDAENQTEEIKNGEIFVEGHLMIVNITADMDGSTVSCEYSKGQYGASVETVFRVFNAELDISEEVCNTHAGYVQLTFKESKRTSPAEETVDEKIKAMIAEMMNVGVKDITVDESGYIVNIPIMSVFGNQAILDMQPNMKIGGRDVKDGLSKCTETTTTTTTTITTTITTKITTTTPTISITTTTKHMEYVVNVKEENAQNDWTIIGIVIGIGILLVAVIIFFKSAFGKKVIIKGTDWASKRGMEMDAETCCTEMLGQKCSYCTFRTTEDIDLEKHKEDYKTTHSTLDYNDCQEEVKAEVSKMKDSGLKLKKVQLTEKQKYYLEKEGLSSTLVTTTRKLSCIS